MGLFIALLILSQHEGYYKSTTLVVSTVPWSTEHRLDSENKATRISQQQNLASNHVSARLKLLNVKLHLKVKDKEDVAGLNLDVNFFSYFEKKTCVV